MEHAEVPLIRECSAHEGVQVRLRSMGEVRAHPGGRTIRALKWHIGRGSGDVPEAAPTATAPPTLCFLG